MGLLRTILQRGLLPAAMLGLGITSLVWGAAHHRLEIYEAQEIEISIAPPPELLQPMELPGDPAGPEGGMGTGFPGDPGFPGAPGFPDPGFGPPAGMPPFVGGPPPELQKIKRTVMVAKQEPESQAVLEITFGGLALLETGELRRTYTGAPPSLCPT